MRCDLYLTQVLLFHSAYASHKSYGHHEAAKSPPFHVGFIEGRPTFQEGGEGPGGSNYHIQIPPISLSLVIEPPTNLLPESASRRACSSRTMKRPDGCSSACLNAARASASVRQSQRLVVVALEPFFYVIIEAV